MTTTSLKLPDNLKTRIKQLADATGKTAHAFMLDALTEQTLREEKRQALIARALEAKAEHEQSGTAYAAEDVHAYLRNKIQGQHTTRPKPIKQTR
ncbi:CopG family ribbon-helix-helix protein [Methylobacillus sp. Pita2]|jgi:predicted transcriptional regulator|uniref:CopG family ribbon-helix-helix protein n=1 Tax=Methylobacillus sp. Pita2 TaxID=3383245 RepID=UPI0038B5B891